jgi:hypothetical protein
VERSRVIWDHPRTEGQALSITIPPNVSRSRSAVVWSYNNCRGLGLSPSPFPRRFKHCSNLNTYSPVRLTSSTGRRPGQPSFPSPFTHRRSRVRPPTTPNQFYIETKQPIMGCHVAALDWAKWHPYQPTRSCHVSTCDSPTSNCRVICRTATLTCCVSLAVRFVSLPRHPLTSLCHVSLQNWPNCTSVRSNLLATCRIP